MGKQASVGVRSQISIRRRDNHALGVTLGRYIVFSHVELEPPVIRPKFHESQCKNSLGIQWHQNPFHKSKDEYVKEL